MNTMIPNMAVEVGNTTSVGNNRAHSNKRGGENECGNVIFSIERGGCLKKPLYNRGR